MGCLKRSNGHRHISSAKKLAWKNKPKRYTEILKDIVNRVDMDECIKGSTQELMDFQKG